MIRRARLHLVNRLAQRRRDERLVRVGDLLVPRQRPDGKWYLGGSDE